MDRAKRRNQASSQAAEAAPLGIDLRQVKP